MSRWEVAQLDAVAVDSMGMYNSPEVRRQRCRFSGWEFWCLWNQSCFWWEVESAIVYKLGDKRRLVPFSFGESWTEFTSLRVGRPWFMCHSPPDPTGGLAGLSLLLTSSGTGDLYLFRLVATCSGATEPWLQRLLSVGLRADLNRVVYSNGVNCLDDPR